jgi:hypothetical protein
MTSGYGPTRKSRSVRSMSAFGGRADSFAHSELSRFCCDAGHRANRALRPICTRHRLNPETCHASPDVETSRASFNDLVHRNVGLLLHRGRIGLRVTLQRCQTRMRRLELHCCGPRAKVPAELAQDSGRSRNPSTWPHREPVAGSCTAALNVILSWRAFSASVPWRRRES